MEADGKGYYAYLPAVFIYNDLSFKFFHSIEKEKYYHPNYYYAYLRVHNDKVINKYYVGTAVSMTPFFAIGHLKALLGGWPADGYSYPYMVWVHFGALVYLLIGLLALRRLLRTYSIDEKWIALTLAAIVFGTNLFYYVLTEFSMSHVYSFSLITCFLLFSRKTMLGGSLNHFLWASVILGWIILIRPVNAVVVFALPFLAGNPHNLKDIFSRLLLKWKYVLSAVLIIAAIASIQAIIYKIQTGDFFVYSYPGEGFEFTRPHMGSMLFSFRKGLFVYTPLLLISLVGFRFLWIMQRFQAVALFVFFLLILYLFSSWHMWYYGGSFSQRVFIDYYARFAILLALTLQFLKGMIRKIYITGIIVLSLFCQYQTYQYRHMVIHWSDMTKEKYFEGFFKLNP